MPYDPGNQNMSGQILGQSISSGLATIADSLVERGKELKKLKAFRAMAVDGLGLDPEKVDKMKLPDLEGQFMSVALKRVRQQEEQQKDFNERMMASLSTIQDPGMSGPIMEEGGMPEPGAMPGGFDINSVMDAASRSGMLTPELAMKFMDQGVNWESLKPRDFMTKSGTPGVYGKGGQFQFDPAGFFPENPEIVDEGGRAFLRNPRGGFTRLPPPKEAKTLPESFNSEFNLLKRQLSDDESNASLDDDALNRLATKGTPAQKRARYVNQAARTRKAIQQHFDRFRKEGFGNPDVWTLLYEQAGLTPPAAAAAPRPAPGKQPAVNKEALLKQAREAIDAKADPVAVKARLKDLYGIEME